MSDASNNRPAQGGSAGQAGQGGSGPGQQASGTVSGLKDQAAGLADSARQAASGAREKLTSTIEEQKSAGADRVSGIAEAIRRAAGEIEGEVPQAADYVRRAANELDNMAEAVRRREFTDLIGNVQDFARRQPTAFLGATALAGFALVRFLKTSGSQPRSSAGTAYPAAGGSDRTGQVPRQIEAAPGRETGMQAGTAARKPKAGAAQPGAGGPSSSSSSGDPGGVAPEAPGFTSKPTGSGSKSS